ncbi:signaling lymphocytic activation molecule-like isoform X2 [Pristis pectinata]|uniref:signaling lymphocytic activation molecule-like isoform X2 n=1 Tax=Pristis pectinata TaxID=685728 RepID=UPI00223DEF96|nr:signaling lymphocytic activation molecule-like isoform X2 [Pristis pectinata]
MVRRGFGIVSATGIICLLLSGSGVLGLTAGTPATRRVVYGALGQSITLPGNMSGENISIITWDYRDPSKQKKVQLCLKTQNNPTKYNRESIRLNLKDYSLEIQNLQDSDQERVSTPVINISKVISDEMCNISLHCSLERGTEPVYTWWTGDGEVTADESHVLTDGGMTLALSLKLNDNTVYNCTVRNPVSEATWSMDLTNMCRSSEGNSPRRTLHIGLITAAAVVAFISAILCYIYWKRESKPNEAPNTEGRSESVLYAVIGRTSNARDQPQRYLHQLDASEGQKNPRAQLTTIYDEIKYNPDVDPLLAATKVGEEFSTQRSSSAT